MEVRVSFDPDADGFLRRECPNCEQQFKWFAGDTEERPDDVVEPDAYHCPYCGRPAAHDAWFTREQIEHAHEVASAMAPGLVADELEDAFRSVKGLTYKPSSETEPPPPAAPIDPADMVMVAPPCHAYEPIKVSEDSLQSPLHCLICGQRFTLGA